MGLIDRLFNSYPIGKWINHRNLYLLGLLMILSGLSWSNLLMSLGGFFIFFNHLLDLNFSHKLKAIRNSPIVLLSVGFFSLHLLGALYSSNQADAWKDIINKVPLILIPLVVGSTESLSKKEWKSLLTLFLISTFIISLVSLGKSLGIIGDPIIDKRELSVGVSHIRYGLVLAFACVLILNFLQVFKSWQKVILLLLIVWLFICLFWFELSTGLVLGILALSIWLVSWFWKSKFTSVKLIPIPLILGSFVLLFYYFQPIYSAYYTEIETGYDQEILNQKTKSGEQYWHNADSRIKENGVYIWRFIAWKEANKTWKSKSELDLDGKDKKGNKLFNTLFRYLSSKGQKKDKEAINKLSIKEIRAIENGIANQFYLYHNPIQNRIYQSIYELDHYFKLGEVNGYSLSMRLEYWMTACRIIKSNFILGVGTGDINDSMKAQYSKDKSKLAEKYQRRPHQQFLSIWMAFGIIGLIYFFIYLVYPLIHLEKDKKLLYLLFLSIAGLSFLSEDTLETQAGVSFFSVFYSLICLGIPSRQKEPSNNDLN